MVDKLAKTVDTQEIDIDCKSKNKTKNKISIIKDKQYVYI